MSKKIVVIGGGLGGLSAAIRLSKSGYNVQLFEQQPSLGGKMNEFRQDGFRFDTGPSLLTMPDVIDDLFEYIGLNRHDYLEFVPIDPICRYFWSDGTTLDATADPSEMTLRLKTLSEEDATSYQLFSNYIKRIYEMTADIFVFSPLHEIKNLLNWQTFVKLLTIHRIDPFRTMDQGIRRFFRHKKVVQLFNRYATYNGSNPFQAPATLNIIPYVEFGLGSYYVKGGMYRLVEVLEHIARSFGVQIFQSTRVDEIVYHKNMVTGIKANDTLIEADYIVSNADVVTAYNDLINGFDKRQERLNKLEPSLSGIVYLWNVNKNFEQLAQHNIIFSDDYENEFEHIFKRKQVPDDPTIYIAITSKIDPDHAPPDGENWFVLINVPHLMPGQDWQREVTILRERIFAKLANHGIDVSEHIAGETFLTPEDFYQKYGSNRGSIYGISSNSKSTAFRRPANRNRDLRGLYFAGGSTHPGGGVPLAMLSGKMCADLILMNKKDY